MKRQHCLVIVGLLFTASVSAGVGSSGGGGAIVCRDGNRKIISAELLDLYEGEFYHDLEIRKNGRPYETQILDALAKLNDEDGSGIRQLILNHVDLVKARFQFLRNGVSLSQPGDLGERNAIVVRDGCLVEGLGFYEQNGRLLVAKGTFSKLSETDKAAFLLHEAVYAIYRKRIREHERVESVRARKVNALLFASGLSKETILTDIVHEIFSWGVISAPAIALPVADATHVITVTLDGHSTSPGAAPRELRGEVVCTSRGGVISRTSFRQGGNPSVSVVISDLGCRSIEIVTPGPNPHNYRIELSYDGKRLYSADVKEADPYYSNVHAISFVRP